MKMTEDGLALIRQFEGFRGEAYRCPAGILTIGYGHTSRAGPPVVSPGLKIGEVEAAAILAADVEGFARDVRSCLTRDLSDNQFSALVSFAYNVGAGNLRESSVLKAVNAGDFNAVPRRLQLWTKAGGRVLPGLVKRRAAEAALFMAEDREEVPGMQRPDGPLMGKTVYRSTTVAAAVVSAIASGAFGALQFNMTNSVTGLVFAATIVVAAAWIVRERRRNSLEEGI